MHEQVPAPGPLGHAPAHRVPQIRPLGRALQHFEGLLREQRRAGLLCEAAHRTRAGEVQRDEAGAVATFLGTVRNRSRDRNVLYLEYEAYEGMAEQTMADLADELAERHELLAVAIHHRVGRVEIGEDTDLLADLSLDSLQVMNLLLHVEDRFDISIPVNILPDVKTVKDLALQIEQLTRQA